MMADECPTGRHYNILRYAKSVVGKLRQEFQNLWEEDKKSISRGDKVNFTGKHAMVIILWVIEGNSRVFYSDTWEVYDRDTVWVVAYTEMSDKGEKEVFTAGGFADTMLEWEEQAVLYNNNQWLVQVRQDAEKWDGDCRKQEAKKKYNEGKCCIL